MEHPLIGDISHLNSDELQTRITELGKKLSWARRNNAYLASQLEMALETYNNQYRAKQQEIYLYYGEILFMVKLKPKLMFLN